MTQGRTERAKEKAKNEITGIDKELQYFVDCKDERADIKEVMSTDAGKRFVSRILKNSEIFAITFTGNANTYYNLGRQDFARRLVTKIIDAGCDLRLTDFIDNLRPEALTNIDNKINELLDKKNKLRDGG